MPLWIHGKIPCKQGGLPHSDIPGSKGARASPGLIAACHVLRRLLVPRHPPDALLLLAPLPEGAGRAFDGRGSRPVPQDPLRHRREAVRLRLFNAYPCFLNARRSRKVDPRPPGPRRGTAADRRPSKNACARIWNRLASSRCQKIDKDAGGNAAAPFSPRRGPASSAPSPPRTAAPARVLRGTPQGTTATPRPRSDEECPVRAPDSGGGPGLTRTADLTLIRRAL